MAHKISDLTSGTVLTGATEYMPRTELEARCQDAGFVLNSTGEAFQPPRRPVKVELWSASFAYESHGEHLKINAIKALRGADGKIGLRQAKVFVADDEELTGYFETPLMALHYQERINQAFASANLICRATCVNLTSVTKVI